MNFKDLFKPFKEDKYNYKFWLPLYFVASLGIFYAPFAPSFWIGTLVFFLWYCFVIFIFLLIKYLLNK